MRLAFILDIGIGIIVPASIEAADFSFDLKYSADIPPRILKSSYPSAAVARMEEPQLTCRLQSPRQTSDVPFGEITKLFGQGCVAVLLPLVQCNAKQYREVGSANHDDCRQPQIISVSLTIQLMEPACQLMTPLSPIQLTILG